MNTTAEHIKGLRHTLKTLQKIAKEMDPASGVTLCARRGVARDNEEAEDDNLRRPWVTVETSDLNVAVKVLGLMEQAANHSLTTWLNIARTERDELTKLLDQ
jgi:hypothetical protein